MLVGESTITKNGVIPILAHLKQLKQTTNKKNVKLNANFMANSLK